MAFSTAIHHFRLALAHAQDPAIRDIALGLERMASALDALEREVSDALQRAAKANLLTDDPARPKP